ncbi:MAG TPA: hypothetical protein VHL58_19185 [Thermoanaerobaculia bacterium]|nr:hypothetical protein [Thermoanaerobaculia bacterium]
MSVTLLRAGLWIVLISFALYVVHETYPDTAIGAFTSGDMLMKAGVVGVLAGVSGFILGFFKKRDPKPAARGRCSVCGRPVKKGDIYCREHLRRIIEDEHDRTHGPGLRPRH